MLEKHRGHQESLTAGTCCILGTLTISTNKWRIRRRRRREREKGREREREKEREKEMSAAPVLVEGNLKGQAESERAKRRGSQVTEE